MKQKPARKAIKPLAVPLWPDAGQMLGLGKCAAYEKAARGEIRTLPMPGRRLVPISWLSEILGCDIDP